MYKTGIANLPLHGGKAPRWLFKRMVQLSESIVTVMVDELSIKEIFNRFSDPFWFQSLTCILGYDWHSSGTTTVTCGALKEAINPEKHGLIFVGGKGKTSRNTPTEIVKTGDIFSLSTAKIEEMKYASKITAKIDNNVIQDFHNLYHHSFFFAESGQWGVIQQGMNEDKKYARRYHWCSEHTTDYLNDPHAGIVGEKIQDSILNMASKHSISNQKICVDLINDHPRHISRDWERLRLHPQQQTLDQWSSTDNKENVIDCLSMPRCMNWKKMHEIYDKQPKNYEEFVSLQGVGAATVRALALISELVYGEAASWNDPIKYTYAHGGKDGVPYPVDTRTMDASIDFIRQGVQEAAIGETQKRRLLQRLKDYYKPALVNV